MESAKRSDAERDPQEKEEAPARQQRVALVTGASGAIGNAIARRFGRDGFDVAVHYHSDKQGAIRAAAAIRNSGRKAFIVQADLTKAAEVEIMVATVIQRWGRIDVLVNNAGITRDTLIPRTTEEDWHAVMDANATSAYLCIKAVSRHMMRQRYGRIINITSVVGITGNAGQIIYASAKAALIGMLRAVARELASRGITANGVAPGFIEGGMTQDLNDELRARAMSHIPLGRFGSVNDVAHIVSCLAHEDAGYVTGQVYGVDGGVVMG